MLASAILAIAGSVYAIRVHTKPARQPLSLMRYRSVIYAGSLYQRMLDRA